jgi:hypothetical protein
LNSFSPRFYNHVAPTALAIGSTACVIYQRLIHQVSAIPPKGRLRGCALFQVEWQMGFGRTIAWQLNAKGIVTTLFASVVISTAVFRFIFPER